MPVYPFVKRLLDIIFSAAAILFFSPLFLCAALIIKAGSKGPVIFKQKRAGRNGKLFTIYKFRTMRVDAPKDVPTHLLADPQAHITRIGRFLRKTSLDELPQLVNIFVGQMSWIGPRPALYNQDDLLACRARLGADAVRPGLTGWAQINGRDEIPVEEKARLDGEYIRRMGFFFDCRCFFATFAGVLKGSGVKEGK
ncbi:MAG: sugar transferase [Defluviitaleaceae bacterium]|nr:sugar transferase [Defluviitaleaceae bacterium]